MVVKQPKFTRVEEPTLLCNHVPHRGDSVPNLPQALDIALITTNLLLRIEPITVRRGG